MSSKKLEFLTNLKVIIEDFLIRKSKVYNRIYKYYKYKKETQKGEMKNQKVQKSKRCENVKSNNRIIQKT